MVGVTVNLLSCKNLNNNYLLWILFHPFIVAVIDLLVNRPKEPKYIFERDQFSFVLAWANQ